MSQTRNLQPGIIAFPYALRKGAIIVLPSPGNGTDVSASPLILSFQYNPETVTRNRTGAWDTRKNQKDPNKKSPPAKANEASFQGGGLYSKAETIALKLIFDATELMLSGSSPTAAASTTSSDVPLGVLPELGILEQIALAEPPKEDANSASAAKSKTPDPNAAKLNALHPKEILLALGPRYFPVIVTSMTITEKRFSPELVPMRAEVDLQMQVLEATAEKGNKVIADAYQQLVLNRAKQAEFGKLSQTFSGDKPTVAALDGAIAKALTQSPPVLP